MVERANTGLSEQFAAAFAWWRDAGVDLAFGDEPTSWLAVPAEEETADRPARRPVAAPIVPAAPPPPTLDPAALPTDLAAFRDWWLREALLDDGRLSGRIAPHGEAGAKLMIVLPEPEREDEDRLLSGPQGRLLEAFLSAAGIVSGDVYVASALPRHTPMADWEAARARGLGDALRRHVVLAAPACLIAFGGNALPLLRNDPANSDQSSQFFNHEGVSIPLLSATDLGALLARPRAKARLWQQWLDWTGPDWMGS